MVCEHLSALEQQMLSAGLRVTFRGQAWHRNYREWVLSAQVRAIARNDGSSSGPADPPSDTAVQAAVVPTQVACPSYPA
jgi:hypothetical protein